MSKGLILGIHSDVHIAIVYKWNVFAKRDTIKYLHSQKVMLFDEDQLYTLVSDPYIALNNPFGT